MTPALYVLAGIVAVAALAAAWRVGRSWARFSGTRVVPCPETKQPVGIDVDARSAAISSLAGAPRLQVRDCTRWPEKRDCGQECLARIEESPEDCLVRNVLAKWYEGKACALCSRPFGTIHWIDHRPALLDAQGVTVEWSEIRPEGIEPAMASHRPVCWDCHIAETFRRKFPDLVVDRNRPSTQVH